MFLRFLPKTMIVLGISIWLVAGIGIESLAQTRQISFPALKVESGEELVVPVLIDDASGVLGFRIVFDLPDNSATFPLEYVPESVSTKNTLTQGWTTIENNMSKVNDLTNPLSGSVLISGSGYMPLKGKGTLLTFKLKAKKKAVLQTIPLRFKTTGSRTSRLNDGAIPITVKDGTIQIVKPGTITPTPSATNIPSPTPTIQPSPTVQPSFTATPKPSPSQTSTWTVTPVKSPSVIPSITVTPARTPSTAPTKTTTPIISPTITVKPSSPPTPTPTYNFTDIIYVTDDLSSFENLCGKTDHDTVQDRGLTIRWNSSSAGLEQHEIADIHIYVRKVNQNKFFFLANTGNGYDKAFDWKKGSWRVEANFWNGPDFNQSYDFQVYFISRTGHPFAWGPYTTSAPVLLMKTASEEDTPTPTPYLLETPSPTPVIPPGKYVLICDDLLSYTDLSNGQDFDSAGDRCLVLRWSVENLGFEADDIKETHVYIKTAMTENYDYLGQSKKSTDFLEWRQSAQGLDAKYQNGPEFKNTYTFAIFFLTKSGNPHHFGPFFPDGAVAFLNAAINTPTARPSNTPTATPTEIPIEIYGTVKELFSGKPIPNASVVIGAQTTRTGTDGSYTITIAQKGTYSIVVQAAGYRPFQSSEYLSRSQRLNLRLMEDPSYPTPVPTFTPTPTPTPVHYVSIYGFVYDPVNFILLPEAEIKVGSRVVSSNQVGFFYMNDVMEGTYTITVTLKKYTAYQKEISIEDNTEIMIPLYPE